MVPLGGRGWPVLEFRTDPWFGVGGVKESGEAEVEAEEQECCCLIAPFSFRAASRRKMHHVSFLILYISIHIYCGIDGDHVRKETCQE